MILDLPTLLRDLRLASGLTIEQAEAKSGYARTQIQRCEAGKSSPTADNLQNLLAVYGARLTVEVDRSGWTGRDLRPAELTDRGRLDLRRRRNRMRLPQRDVAAVLHVHERVISEVETGRRGITRDEYQRWTAFLAEQERAHR